MAQHFRAALVAFGLAVLSLCLVSRAFVQPGEQTSASLRSSPRSASGAQPDAAVPEETAAMPAAAGALAVGVAAAALLGARSGRTSRTVVNFFSSSRSVSASFDPTTQLGIQAPARYWDPLGLAADKNEANFKRRRAVEIKHGRISMLAAIGYIVPEYTRFSGYLSPSQGLKFTDVPNGLAAISKVPFLGWVQIVMFCGMCEVSGLQFGKAAKIGIQKDASMAGEPGNYGLGFLGAQGLLGTIKDKETRDRKLNAEIANGRLAMFAIMAMFFQNGVTGTTGPEMWGGVYVNDLALQILIPSIIIFAIGGETFRRGPGYGMGKAGEAFRAGYDRPDVFKYKGKV